MKIPPTPISDKARSQRPYAANLVLNHVYIISTVVDGEHVAPVKIGISQDVAKRFGGIRTSCPNEIAVTFAFPLPGRDFAETVEKLAHRVGEKSWRRGEWFDLHPLDAIILVAACIRGVSDLYGRKGEDQEEDLRITGVYDAFLFTMVTWPALKPLPQGGAG